MMTGYLEECEGWVEAGVLQSTLLGLNLATSQVVDQHSDRLAVFFRWVFGYETP
jgi:hypothetical protein